MTDTIFVALQDEGISVWRPVPAYKIDSSTFIVLKPQNYDPSLENWEFPPGSIVNVAPRQVSGSVVNAATRLADHGKQIA